MKLELSKKEKAIMRQLINKGVQAEFANALRQAEDIIFAWKSGDKPNSDAYHELYESLQQNNKFIAMRYDGMSGSRYLPTVIGIYRDKQIKDEDLKDLSDDLKEHIKQTASYY